MGEFQLEGWGRMGHTGQGQNFRLSGHSNKGDNIKDQYNYALLNEEATFPYRSQFSLYSFPTSTKQVTMYIP